MPEEAITYARTDVHWLGQLAAVLLRDLENSASAGESRSPFAVERVWQKSQAVAALVYHEANPSEAAAASATSLLRKQRHEQGLSACAGRAAGDAEQTEGRLESRSAQRSLLALCAWRDKLARKLDEGTDVFRIKPHTGAASQIGVKTSTQVLRVHPRPEPRVL